MERKVWEIYFYHEMNKQKWNDFHLCETMVILVVSDISSVLSKLLKFLSFEFHFIRDR